MAHTAEGTSHAFLYKDGVMTDVGGLGGTESAGQDINDHGQITGYADLPGDKTRHAFLYSNGIMIELESVTSTTWSSGYSINNRGQIVGISSALGHTRAFLHEEGAFTYLPTFGGPHGGAHAINNTGQVAGAAYNVDLFTYNAFRYSNGSLTNLGDLGVPFSVGRGINDAGDVVGMAEIYPRGFHAFVSTGGMMIDLGTGYANSINNAGQIVGWSYFEEDSNLSQAFLYSDGTMTNLNSLIDPSDAWNLVTANAINESGQIVGEGWGPLGYHAYLLTPTGIPEPATLFLLAVAAVPVLIRTRRRP
jgi:probable HAF family extracellular repeat protein